MGIPDIPASSLFGFIGAIVLILGLIGVLNQLCHISLDKNSHVIALIYAI